MCATNQHLRLQNPGDADRRSIADNPFYDPTIYDVINPSRVDRSDRGTGVLGRCVARRADGGSLPRHARPFPGTDHLYVDLVNGLHTESLSPTIFARAVEFLDLYVAKRTPSLGAVRVSPKCSCRSCTG